MSFRFIAYALWCVGVFTGTASSAYYAWSPFADASRDDRSQGLYGRSGGIYGPSHK